MSSRTVASITSRTPDQPLRAPMVSAIGSGMSAGTSRSPGTEDPLAARRPGRNDGSAPTHASAADGSTPGATREPLPRLERMMPSVRSRS